MADLNPESKFSLSLKEIVGAVIALSSLFGIYFTLQSSVAANTEDIDALKTNSVNPVEFQYKDELVRSTIQRVEEKTDVLSGDVKAFTMENLIMPHGIALTADDSKLLVGSSMGDAVYIVDAQSMILLHSIYFSDINMDMDEDMNMNSMHMPTGLAIVQE